jgi:hypothetical protein
MRAFRTQIRIQIRATEENYIWFRIKISGCGDTRPMPTITLPEGLMSWNKKNETNILSPCAVLYSSALPGAFGPAPLT